LGESLPIKPLNCGSGIDFDAILSQFDAVLSHI